MFNFTKKELELIMDGLYTLKSNGENALNDISTLDKDADEMYCEFSAYIESIEALLKKMG